MSVYTPAAAVWANANATNITNALNISHQTGRTVMNNSNVGVNLRLVSTRQVSYTESGNFGTDLNRLAGQNNGHMDAVHTWRNQDGADLVTLFIHRPENVPIPGGPGVQAGLGNALYDPRGRPDQAFSVVEVFWYDDETQIHELGHNMGAGHHKHQTSPGPQLFSYSAGWRYQVGGQWYNTVMAYDIGSEYSRPEDGAGINSTTVPFFSTPLLSHGGVPRGHAAHGDNARTIRETKCQSRFKMTAKSAEKWREKGAY